MSTLCCLNAFTRIWRKIVSQRMSNLLNVVIEEDVIPINLGPYEIQSLSHAVVFETQKNGEHTFWVDIEFLDEFKIDPMTHRRRARLPAFKSNNKMLSSIAAKHITKAIKINLGHNHRILETV